MKEETRETIAELARQILDALDEDAREEREEES